jgi:uncharacterized membrane protein
MAIADTTIPPPITKPAPSRLPTWLALIALAVIFTAWFVNAPAGLLGKADSIGYAICHRIDSRSFHIGNVQFPLCARCTGIYLGVVLGIGIMAALGRWRGGSLPPRRVMVVMVLFISVMGVDGVNSYMKLLPGLSSVYEPQNWLRLLTGILTGVAVSGLIYPVFNQTLWQHWQDRPVVRGLGELFTIVLAALIVAGLVLTNNPIILYPLALISAGGVVLLMSMLNAIIFVLVTGTANRATRWRDLLMPLAVGLTISLSLILTVDVLRFAVTHTWDGFIIPGA